MNNQVHGPVGEIMAGCMMSGSRFEPGLLRPYIDGRGQRCVTINTGRTDPAGKPIYEKRLVADLMNAGISSPVFNATSLRKNEWIELDTVVVKAARARLRAWADLAQANTFTLNGMGKTIFEHETMSDPGEAIVDMDGLTEGRTDSPKFQLEGLPLPITHSDFWFSSRRLAASRSSGTPLDLTMAEAAGRRVAEMIEKTLIGVETGIAYGASTTYSRTSQVYGYTNFPDRITKTDLTTPTGANPEAIVSDVLEMVELLQSNNFFGPYMLYVSTGYSRYLNDDYFRTGSTSAVRSVRERILQIDGIQDVRRLDFLTSGFQMILVQMTSNVARAINGMDLTTVQWESQGGLRLNFKCLTICVPQLRSTFSGDCGVLHATTA